MHEFYKRWDLMQNFKNLRFKILLVVVMLDFPFIWKDYRWLTAQDLLILNQNFSLVSFTEWCNQRLFFSFLFQEKLFSLVQNFDQKFMRLLIKFVQFWGNFAKSTRI